MQYLTIQDLIYIHEEVIRVSGGSPGVRDLGLVDSALNRPKATFDKEYLYPSLFDKSAALFHSLIMNHAFVDGNKRTAVAAAAQILYINGFELVTSEKELEKFTLNIIKRKIEVEEIASWLEKYAVKLK